MNQPPREPLFLSACRRRPVDTTPVWLMRQAGRYLPEYRELRRRFGMLEICRKPELACEVTLQPMRRFPLDAAIVFADILLPLEPMGVGFHFAPDHGPRIEEPIRDAAQIRRLRLIDPDEDLGYVMRTIRLVRSALDDDRALIGFAGAPFTLASYMIEGGYSRHFLLTKRLMYEDELAWMDLMERVTEVTVRYLKSQIAAGAQAVQVFDSWVGCLAPEDYRRFIFPHLERIFDALAQETAPSIYFSTGSATLLPFMRQLKADVIGVDWRIELDDARALLGPQFALQGNLDPAMLFAPPERLESEVERILRRTQNRSGHIFNLGHGILPETAIDQVSRLVDRVHAFTPASRDV